jgi:hypothetical protein
MKPAAVLSLIGYTIGLPTAFLCILVCFRREIQEDQVRIWGGGCRHWYSDTVCQSVATALPRRMDDHRAAHCAGIACCPAHAFPCQRLRVANRGGSEATNANFHIRRRFQELYRSVLQLVLLGFLLATSSLGLAVCDDCELSILD